MFSIMLPFALLRFNVAIKYIKYDMTTEGRKSSCQNCKALNNDSSMGLLCNFWVWNVIPIQRDFMSSNMTKHFCPPCWISLAMPKNHGSCKNTMIPNRCGSLLTSSGGCTPSTVSVRRPNLNPIENVWRVFKANRAQRKCRTEIVLPRENNQ